ncbi:MAG: hypothetical protein BTN85_1921 [Candidatus Methanohalarchaeum thermophilum]|uniref:Uncharacterized protein n=1 Tax=Methanohalarchaeum thermophilum TaxID=1903181 RepID=A0A1Q6DSF0_METT1|nr:MAG: hypothetical protein BTN85_1921 [Candidatus Methanohalarchaeum thermophilum]
MGISLKEAIVDGGPWYKIIEKLGIKRRVVSGKHQKLHREMVPNVEEKDTEPLLPVSRIAKTFNMQTSG